MINNSNLLINSSIHLTVRNNGIKVSKDGMETECQQNSKGSHSKPI